MTDTLPSFYSGTRYDSGMDDKDIAISKVKECLTLAQRTYASHDYLKYALQSLEADLFGAAIIYFGIALEAELCEMLKKGIEDKRTEDLLKEAVDKGLITPAVRDEINGIMWLRDAHAHSQGTLNRRTWRRLRTIANEYGIPTLLLSPNPNRIGYIIDFNSACLARKIAEKMWRLLQQMISKEGA